jgi:hypothetical protein
VFYLGCVGSDCVPIADLQQLHHINMSVQFFVLTILYGYYGYKVSKQKQLPFFTDASPLSIALTTAFVWLIFASRTTYNILVSINQQEFTINLTQIPGEVRSFMHTICM